MTFTKALQKASKAHYDGLQEEANEELRTLEEALREFGIDDEEIEEAEVSEVGRLEDTQTN